MKTIKFISTIVLSVNMFFGANAQVSLTTAWNNKSGVYLNHSDYLNKRLKFEVDYTKEKHKIRVHDFFSKSNIDVIHDGIKYTLQKKDIYGIRDAEEKDYRFYNNKEYMIADTGTIYIYKTQSIENSGGKQAQAKYITNYFFSTTGSGVIVSLSLKNIKMAYPENHKLHELIDANFKSNNELSSFDEFHKTFKVLHFLKGNLK